MKKALIPALLVACAVFAPFLRNAVEFPDRVSKAACAAARPLFWHLWYELLNRAIATGSQRARNIGAASDCQLGLRSDLAVCIVFHVFLKHTPRTARPLLRKDTKRLLCRFHVASFVAQQRGNFSRVAQLPAI
jgi:uncharacterized protein YbjT (DUF2867 family)